MTEEELERIRKNYQEKLAKRAEILQLGQLIKQYEQDEKVQKYLELIDLYRKNTTGHLTGYDKKTDSDLLYSTLSSVRINSTNNIYIYMGTYKKNIECDIVHGSNDYRVNIRDPQADYRIYRNLELMSYQRNCEIEVPIKDCLKFEQEHIVIYPKGTSLCDQFYLKLHDEFFNTAIKESQEKALEKVLKLRHFPKNK